MPSRICACRSTSAARFLASRGNVGFARASNLGLQSGRGRHVLLLNPDAVLHPGAVESMVAHLDASPGTAIVGPRLLNPDGSLQFSCRRFPGWLTIFFGRYALLSRLFPGNSATRSYLYQDLGHARLRSVESSTSFSRASSNTAAAGGSSVIFKRLLAAGRERRSAA